MAITIGTNLTTLDDNDNSANWSGTDGPDAYNVHIQGTNSESWLVSKNSTETAQWSDGSSHDMSATGTHFFIWLKTDLSNYYTSVTLELRSTSGNYKRWVLADQSTRLWDGSWKCFVVDVNGSGTETGNFASNNVNNIDIILNNSTSGNIRSVTNTWIDAMRYGTGVDVYESTSAAFDLGDIEAVLNSETNKLGVIARNPYTGILEIQCPIIISGNGTDTNFTSENEILAWIDNEYVADDWYKLSWVDSDLDVVMADVVVTSYGTNSNTRFKVDSSGTVGSFDMDGTAFIRGDTITFKAGQTIDGCKFTNCLQVIPPSGTGSFTKNQFINSVATDGALLWPADDTVISDLTFTNCDYGVEYDSSSDSSSPTFTNIVFDDVSGNYDVNNTSGGSVAIGQAGTSNANSYTGSTTTFPVSITLTLTVKDEAGDPIVGAYAYIDDDDTSPYILNTTTGAGGIASTGYSGSSVSGARWRVRKYGYKPFKLILDIGSSNISIPVTLVADPQQT